MIDPGQHVQLDGSFTWTSVNSGDDPASLEREELSMLVNGTLRGQGISPRPGIVERPLAFLAENTFEHPVAPGTEDATLRSNFEGGRWQGATFYDSSPAQLVCSIGGRVFRIRLDNWKVTQLNEETDLNAGRGAEAWFQQVENYVVVQDGRSLPLIVGSGDARRAASNEVPTGTVMEYCKGRLWVALPSGHTFQAGNLAYSTTGNPSDALLFTENTFLEGGGSFAIPGDMGRITGMRLINQMDTSFGHGPLMIGTERGFTSVDAPMDRTQWITYTQPIQTILPLNTGPQGQKALVNVNGDLWYRDNVGIRSLRMAATDFNAWENTPMSYELDRILKHDSLLMLPGASAVVFDNRLLVTVAPVPTATHTYWQGLGVLDFHTASKLRKRVSPRWEGIWTGLDILQLVVAKVDGEERCFIFAQDADDDITLWELSRSRLWDWVDGADRNIELQAETAGYSGPDGPMGLKELVGGALWFDQLTGPVSHTTQYRSDQYPGWRAWHTGTLCARAAACATGASCHTPTHYEAQFRGPVGLPLPADTEDTYANRLARFGYSFQSRLVLTGAVRLKRMRFNMRSVLEPDVELLADESCTSAGYTCSDLEDLFSYQIDT